MSGAVDVVDAMLEVAGRLEAGGVRVALDARDLNPPALLLLPPRMTFRFKDGSWGAEWAAIAVAPSAGTTDALTVLSALIADAREALAGAPATATPQTLSVDGTTDPLPAYQLEWTARVPA